MKKNLKNSLTGFHGEIFDIIKPLEKKYALSIAMALSSILEHFVVDSIADSHQVG